MNISKLLVACIILILCLFPATYFCINELTNEFLYQNMAYVQWTLNDHHLILNSLGHNVFDFVKTSPGNPIFLSIVTRVCNFPIANMQFLPIGFVALMTASFSLSYRLSKSVIMAVLVVFYLSYEASHLPITYSVFAYALTLPLFILFILIYIHILKEKKVSYIIILFIIFLGANYIHYTIAAWMIFFVIFVGIIRFLLTMNSINYTLPLTILLIVFYLSFNNVLYGSYLPAVVKYDLFVNAQKLLSIRIESLFGRDGSSILYANPGSQLLNILSIANVALLMLVGLIGVYVVVLRYLSTRQLSRPTLIISSLFMVGLIDMFVYFLRGTFSTKYISLIFPFIAIYFMLSLEFKCKKILRVILICILFFVLIAKSWIFATSGYISTHKSRYADFVSSATWYYKYSNKDATILADLHTYGRYLVIGARYNIIPNLRYYDEKSYGLLIGSELYDKYHFENKNFSIIIDNKSIKQPIKSFWWWVFQPLVWHKKEINNNKYFNLNYNDGKVWIMPVCHEKT